MTKIISRKKHDCKSSKNVQKNSTEISCDGLPRSSQISIPILSRKETALKLENQNTEIN